MSESTLPNDRWLGPDVVKRAFEDMERGITLAREAGKPIVGVMGSARVQPGDSFYEHCKELAERLGKEGYAILTGGGSGIMAAANEGATAAGAPSMGIRMELLKEEHVGEDHYTDLAITRELLCVRRFILTTVPSAIIGYPGGYGTINEISEILMLVQNRITAGIPIICVEDSKGFWTKLKNYMKEQLADGGYINPSDLDLFKIINIEESDSIDRIVGLVKRGIADTTA